MLSSFSRIAHGETAPSISTGIATSASTPSSEPKPAPSETSSNALTLSERNGCGDDRHEREQHGGDQHEQAQRALVGPAVGHAAAEPVADRQRDEHDRDRVRPHDRRGAEERRHQARGGDLGAQRRGADDEDEELERREPARLARAGVPASGSVLVEAEIGLAGPADRAEPVGGDLLEGRSRRDAAVGIAFSRVVDEPAGLADPLLGCARRSHGLIVGSPAHGGRQTGTWRGAQHRRRDDAPRGRHGDRAARRRRRARGAARQAQPRAAVHGRRVGVPRRRGRRRTRTSRVAGVREVAEEAAVDAARPGGAGRVLALDHARAR